MSALHNYDPPLFEPHELRDAAIDALTDEAVEALPLWVKADYIQFGVDLRAAAREGICSDEALIAERVAEMESAEAAQ